MRIFTWPEAVKNERELIQQFLAYPEVLVHVRKPAMSLHDCAAFIADFTPAQRLQLVLHQHQSYSRDWGLGRVHYSAAQRALRNNDNPIDDTGLHLSTSTHSWSEFNSLSAMYNAAFISPVFSSISKADYPANEKLWDIRQRTNKHTQLIALGGIRPQNMNQIKQGYDGFATCGGIWMSDRPLQAFKSYYNSWYN